MRIPGPAPNQRCGCAPLLHRLTTRGLACGGVEAVAEGVAKVHELEPAAGSGAQLAEHARPQRLGSHAAQVGAASLHGDRRIQGRGAWHVAAPGAVIHHDIARGPVLQGPAAGSSAHDREARPLPAPPPAGALARHQPDLHAMSGGSRLPRVQATSAQGHRSSSHPGGCCKLMPALTSTSWNAWLMTAVQGWPRAGGGGE